MPVKYDPKKVIKPDTEYQWTQEMVHEYSQCARSVMYFALNHCKVTHPTQGVIQLQPRDYQKRMLKLIDNHRLSIYNCPRQIGKCCDFVAKITIKNKKTGVVMKIPIGEFYEMIEKEK
jgi:hypothetical protein